MNRRNDQQTFDSLELLEARLREMQESEAAGPLLEVIGELRRMNAALEGQKAEISRRMAKLDYDARIAGLRLRRIERVIEKLQSFARPISALKARIGQAVLHSRIHSLYERVRPQHIDENYAQWAQEQAARTAEASSQKAAGAAGLKSQPLISVIMPVHRPDREWLEDALRSVARQSYSRWELCVCDDASDPWVREYFVERIKSQPTLRFTHSPQRLGISGALNRALELARGDYFGFLDQDDLLSPFALERVAAAVQYSPAADLVYTDEDLIDGAGRPVAPVFKPDWSPDLLLACMYICHWMVVSREAMSAAGGFRSEFDGAQDYDLALRLTDGHAEIRHIPEVLYHWRTHAGSTAGNAAAKPYALAAGKRALDEAIRRRGWRASVLPTPVPNAFDVRWSVTNQPLTSLIVCSRNPKLLGHFLSSVGERTRYALRQIVVVQHTTGPQESMDRLLSKATGVKAVRYEGPFHFSRMNNLGAATADGEIFVFLNDDTAPADELWLERLVAQCQRPDVGVVGAKLLYPNGALQHAGMAIAINDGCGHPGRGLYTTPYWRWTAMTRDVSAVTGACLAVRRELFEQLGGFDPDFPDNYNDVDFCLRARKAGYRIVYDAGAVLSHYECATRKGGVAAWERDRWYDRWAADLERGDPFYNRNLTRMGEDASLRSQDEP